MGIVTDPQKSFSLHWNPPECALPWAGFFSRPRTQHCRQMAQRRVNWLTGQSTPDGTTSKISLRLIAGDHEAEDLSNQFSMDADRGCQSISTTTEWQSCPALDS
jgi:hypothetical protein